MTEYSVESLQTLILSQHSSTSMEVISALRAFQERIKADESAAPVRYEWRVRTSGKWSAWMKCKRREVEQKLPYLGYAKDGDTEHRKLFTHPPAQAAQVDRVDITNGPVMKPSKWAPPYPDAATDPFNTMRGMNEPVTDAEPVAPAPRCDEPGCNCATWFPDGCVWDTAEPVAQGEAEGPQWGTPEMCELLIARCAELREEVIAAKKAAQPRAVPDAIVELVECRKRGWNDSAPAYRAGWNDCRDAYFAAQRDASEINKAMLAAAPSPGES